MSEYPDKYLEGIRLFNEQEFFECHEVLEELWSETLGEEKKFYQGLIQAAVALFHFGNENLGGARKLYQSSRSNLERYGSYYQGLDLEKFHSDMKFCFQQLLEADPDLSGRRRIGRRADPDDSTQRSRGTIMSKPFDVREQLATFAGTRPFVPVARRRALPAPVAAVAHLRAPLSRNDRPTRSRAIA